MSGLKIGWMGSYEGYLNTEPGVLELCEASLGRLTREGAIVESCRPQYDMDRLWQTWLTLRHWTCHGTRALYDDPESRRLLKPEAVWEIEGSFDTSAADIYEAGIARADWFRALGALFDEYDFLVLPTAQVFPFSKELHWPQSINGVQMDTYHRWMEVVIGGPWLVSRGQRAGWFRSAGPPHAYAGHGAFGEDQAVLELSMAYELVTDHLDGRPDLRRQQVNPRFPVRDRHRIRRRPIPVGHSGKMSPLCPRPPAGCAECTGRLLIAF